MMCISGPPCTPGKTVRSSSFAYRSRQRTRPPRGPRSVLCVVVVTKSECGTGLGCTPAATRPAMCAMSVNTAAPTRSAARRKRREVDDARVRARADDDHLRLVLVGEAVQFVVVDAFVVLPHAVRDDRVELAREVQRVPVREVAAVRQVHAEHGVARLAAASGTPPCSPARRSAAARWHVRRRTAPWRARSPRARRRPRTRSRRSSACPDSLRRTCS